MSAIPAPPSPPPRPPDLNCKLLIAVVTANSKCWIARPNSKPTIRVVPTGPQLQALDRSSPHRTQCQTATSGFKVIPAGPQLQALDRSGPCQTGTARSQPSLPDLNSNLWIKVIAARQTSTASSRSHFSLPNSNSNLCIKVIPAGPQLPDLDRSFPPDPNSNDGSE